MTRHPELYHNITELNILSFYHQENASYHIQRKKYHKLYSTTGDHSNHHNLLHQSSSEEI